MFAFYRFYKHYVIVPSLLATLIGLILLFTHDGSGYTSEWAVDDGYGLAIFLGMCLSWGVCFLSLSLFLNEIKNVRDILVLSALSWFLLPCALCMWVLVSEALNIYSVLYLEEAYYGSISIDIYISFIALLHLASLLVGFLRFRRDVQVGKMSSI
jgi:hypothetical protein